MSSLSRAAKEAALIRAGFPPGQRQYRVVALSAARAQVEDVEDDEIQFYGTISECRWFALGANYYWHITAGQSVQR